jgi:hypothetical protein
MINTNGCFSNYGMTLFSGLSSDELIPFDQNTNDLYIQFQQNNISSTNSYITSSFWGFAYNTIYGSNAILEGLSDYSGVSDSIRNEIIGESKFIRAFCNFYLVNLFGNIPLQTTINWQKTGTLSRVPTTDVYAQIVNDLKDAQTRLASDYSFGSGQRIIPNKWAATALLARVYLYQQQWDSAEVQATKVINNTNLYNLTNNLDSVFLENSSEAIWQLQQANNGNTFNATPEGYRFIPFELNSTIPPFIYLTTQLLNSFEQGDKRRQNWIDSSTYNGTEYYIPYKYKVGPAQATPGAPYSEYYMVFRLSEQYLIRSEARAHLDENNALDDLNIVRKRAGLTSSASVTKSEILNSIMHERQIEFFAEFGHRWLDLKRTQEANTVLSTIKPLWQPYCQLYPIPLSELKVDPNLTQNPGY